MEDTGMWPRVSTLDCKVDWHTQKFARNYWQRAVFSLSEPLLNERVKLFLNAKRYLKTAGTIG
jgi:hypothetical protein